MLVYLLTFKMFTFFFCYYKQYYTQYLAQFILQVCMYIYLQNKYYKSGTARPYAMVILCVPYCSLRHYISPYLPVTVDFSMPLPVQYVVKFFAIKDQRGNGIFICFCVCVGGGRGEQSIKSYLYFLFLNCQFIPFVFLLGCWLFWLMCSTS